jgi:ribonucleoside-diphosphate reductase alpha chain
VLVTSNDKKEAKAAVAAVEIEDPFAPPRARRHKLPDERISVTHKFNIAGHEGYITVGLYKNGMPGELFITMAKEGSTVSGLMDSFACASSIALQHGVPLRLLCDKFAHTRFEPSGWSNNPDIGFAKSIMDYIFRWLELRFLTGQQGSLFDDLHPKQGMLNGPVASETTSTSNVTSISGNPQRVSGNDYSATTPRAGSGTSGHASDALSGMVDLGDAPSCHVCGAIMTRNGSCYRCMSCGSTSGCS